MWFATGVVLTMVAAMMITQAWSVGAAPGDSDSTVVGVSPPVRILDTRDGTDIGLPGPFASPTGQKLQVTGSIPTTTGTQIVVPEGSTGVLLNVTAINATNKGFVSVRPGDASGTPTTSSLNFEAGVTTPNAVTVALPTSGSQAGKIDITYSSAGTTGPTSDVFIDVVGFLTDSTLDEIAQRLTDLETDPGKIVNKSDTAAPTPGATLAAARAAAPEIPLLSTGVVELYAKCLFDVGAAELYGEIYARTSVDGVIMEGADDHPEPTGATYLNTTTPEEARRLDIGDVSGGDLANISEADGYLIQPDGTYTHTLTAISLRKPAAPAGDGPFGAGNACIFSATVLG
jgi:hypothetical protein